MEQKVDKAGNSYYDVANVRITIIQRTRDGHPGLRIQAYKEGRGLFQGAEIPIPDKIIAFDLIQSLLQGISEVVERIENC